MNDKMPTIVGILSFMSTRTQYRDEHDKYNILFITSTR